jgi:hypothetical protein
MEYNKNMLFFCYDLALKNRLKGQGIKFITTAITNDNKRFWLFWKTDEVTRIIEQHGMQ